MEANLFCLKVFVMKGLVLGLLIPQSLATDLPYSGNSLLRNLFCLKTIERHHACHIPRKIRTNEPHIKPAANQGLSNE